MVHLRGLLPRLSSYDVKFDDKAADTYASSKSVGSSLLSTGLIVSYVLTLRALVMQHSFGFEFAIVIAGLASSVLKLIIGVLLTASDLTAPLSSSDYKDDIEKQSTARLIAHADGEEMHPGANELQVIRGEIRALNLALIFADVCVSVCTGILAGVGITIKGE